MSRKAVERLLAESGFVYVREAKTGEIWTDGNSTVMAGRDLSNHRSMKNLEADIKRAVRSRPGYLLDASPTSVKPKDRFSNTIKYGNPVPLIETIYDKKYPKEELPLNLNVKPRDEEEQRVRRRRFSDEDRLLVWTRIGELMKADLDVDDITSKMRKEGWTMSNKDEFERDYVVTVMKELRANNTTLTGQLAAIANDPRTAVVIKATQSEPVPGPEPTPMVIVTPNPPAPRLVETPALPKPVEAPSTKLPSYVVGILKDADLTDRQKIQMICIYAGV